MVDRGTALNNIIARRTVVLDGLVDAGVLDDDRHLTVLGHDAHAAIED
ncbi:hypothetical protein OO015_13695 (plasmid) [Thermomicrobium sp. 4228-Ro]|nr:hypothetical protein [Thermomicrobium sp. 4228-Ro]MCX2728538.1 hypothetical protein [Thermomicrobium sp. 4228-Ro]